MDVLRNQLIIYLWRIGTSGGKSVSVLTTMELGTATVAVQWRDVSFLVDVI